MSNRYPLTPLGNVLTQNTSYIEVPEPKLYPKLSVRLYGKGVVLDTPADGSHLKMRRHQLAKAGQVILSEIWGKKGAIGFVPPQGDGALCTSHFFLFDIDHTKIKPEFLQAIFTANYLSEQLYAEARGTTGYAAVRPKMLLAATIPLPSLEEQRRIVTRIDDFSAKIEEARRFRNEVSIEHDSLLRSMIFNSPVTPTPMNELVKPIEPDVIVQRDQTYHFAGVYSFGRGVFKGQKKSGMDFAYPRLTTLRTNDFVYPKLMAWEGALGVVPPECDGLVVSTEFPVFKIDQTKVLPETLDVYFRSPTVWPRLSGASTGTNVRRRRLNPSDFLDYKFPLPSMDIQQRLRMAKANVDAIKKIRSETAIEFDALIPSILDKAFKGEL